MFIVLSFSPLSLSLLFLFSSSESDYNTEFDCFLRGKDSLRMDSTAHEMKGLTRDQVLSMHHLSKQLRAFENLPYHVSGNDVSEMIVLIGAMNNTLKIVFVCYYCEL